MIPDVVFCGLTGWPRGKKTPKKMALIPEIDRPLEAEHQRVATAPDPATENPAKKAS